MRINRYSGIICAVYWHFQPSYRKVLLNVLKEDPGLNEFTGEPYPTLFRDFGV